MVSSELQATLPPVTDGVRGFDQQSGGLVERLVFNNRRVVIATFVAMTLVLGYFAARVDLDASFLKTIPTSHPFIVNFLKFEDEVKGLGTSLRVAVEAGNATESIFDPAYLAILRDINDEIYQLQGVDRAYMKSLWMPAVRWLAVTAEGYEGGPVIPDNYNASAEAVASVRQNALRSGEIGHLVAPDLKSSIIYIPLVETPEQRLNYADLSRELEGIRTKYEAKGVKIYIIGFAKVMGDVIAGLNSILGFLAGTVAVTLLALWYFVRSVRLATLIVATTMIALVWLVGWLVLVGMELNPYTVLIPFLVFSVGVSHGSQFVNAVVHNVARGKQKLEATRYAFRRLLMTATVAITTNVVGFAVLTIVAIPVIRELAIIASLGMALLILTNLILLPVLLSYTGVSSRVAAYALARDAKASQRRHTFALLDRFAQRGPATLALGIALGLGVVGYVVGQEVQIGDLDEGAPELRPESRYNRDNAFVVSHYQAGTDVFVVFASTEPAHCVDYQNLRIVDELGWKLRQLPVVDSVRSFAAEARRTTAGLNEGSLKWYDLPKNQLMINSTATRAPRELFNASCDLLPVYAYLKDHKSRTLDQVTDAVETFAGENQRPGLQLLLAGGNAGIEVATNQVVRKANWQMNFGVYLGVIILCLIAFRSWRAMLCAVLPLMLISILAAGLMVALGVGIKVATLPVIALGVGIGVDYALYVLGATLAGLKSGASLEDAYFRALNSTGRVVIFTGFTLAIGVSSWVMSPIKYQADMGILLAFMFLGNMIAALVLVPALANLMRLDKGQAA